MQAVCSTSASTFKGLALPRRAPRTGVAAARPVLSARVSCKAENNVAKKVAAVSAAIPAAIATHPAFALVDSRLNGDGTGKILGIDSGIEAIVFLAVFTLIWVLYFNSQKDLDDGRTGATWHSVDSRLNGDGTGKALGIGTGVEGFVILGVFGLIWALYYISSRDLGDGRGQGDDSGLSL
ncbi:g6755 [Coccomyxa viridis]|uniref:PSII 6.1 kDa protein n=1 Tax=Coccomyxa viridis TaxID=1274662 RepID=A0ABP1FW63_9CHLO